MRRVIIYGAGGTGKRVIKRMQADMNIEIVAVADTFKRGSVEGIDIIDPQNIPNLQFDYICLATVHFAEVRALLIKMGISQELIMPADEIHEGDQRVSFLKNLSSEIYRKGIRGSVAEAGVFRGEFSKKINNFFYDRDLYLFDTFEGFDERDIKYEENYQYDRNKGDYFKNTSVSLVMSKMPYPKNVIIKKGFVPDTFEGIEDEFCFVNLDMDLYKPTLEALKFFYPRVVPGGGY